MRSARLLTIKRHAGNTRLAALPWVLLFVAFVLLVAISAAPAKAESIPHAANAHRDTLVRAAHYSLGLNAPIATLGAQVHQESRWIERAKSPVGAQGLTQFMPATAVWMAQVYPHLGPADAFNPGWALRAMVQYDAWLLERVQAASNCDAWSMTLAAYNGGLGWVYRDQALARRSGSHGLTWFRNLENFNAGRSAANFAENRTYVQRIVQRWQPLYEKSGWGTGVCNA